jgi:tetratricopeptide (TPR) repeat protein
LEEIDLEMEDVRAAWEWAAGNGAVHLLDQSCEPMYFYYRWRQRHTEGGGAFRSAAAGLTEALDGALPAATAEPPGLLSSDGAAAGAAVGASEAQLVLANVLALQIPFSVTLGHREDALQLLERSAEILGRAEVSGHDVRRARAWLLTQKGHMAAVSHDLKEWRRATGQALALFRELDDRWMVAHLLGSTGFAAQSLGAYDEARELHQECLAIRRQLGDPIAVADSFERLGYLAMELGELEEGERLRREYVSILRRTRDKAEIAFGLMTLGWSLVWLGRFAEAHSVSRESLRHWSDLGLEDRAGAIRTHPLLGIVQLHLGRYESARATMGRALRIASRYAMPRPPGHRTARPMQALGAAALGEGDHVRAERQLARCVEAIGNTVFFFSRLDLGRALADLAVAERALGRRSSARLHLGEALRTVDAAGGCGFSLPMASDVFLAGGLLLSDRGEAELAVELFSLAYRQPHVANSRWYADVFGKHIATVEETLPSGVVAAARERGRARDPDATAAELLAELESDEGG